MDYRKKCEAAKAELQDVLNDLNGREYHRGNLKYLVKHTIFYIEGIEKYMGRFGTDEHDLPIAHVGYTKESMGYDK